MMPLLLRCRLLILLAVISPYHYAAITALMLLFHFSLRHAATLVRMPYAT